MTTIFKDTKKGTVTQIQDVHIKRSDYLPFTVWLLILYVD